MIPILLKLRTPISFCIISTKVQDASFHIERFSQISVFFFKECACTCFCKISTLGFVRLILHFFMNQISLIKMFSVSLSVLTKYQLLCS